MDATSFDQPATKGGTSVEIAISDTFAVGKHSDRQELFLILS